MSLRSIATWVLIYFVTAVVFCAAAFGYFSGWWDDASIVAIVLMFLTGFLAGRLTKTDYFIGRLVSALNQGRAGDRARRHSNNYYGEEGQHYNAAPEEYEEDSILTQVFGQVDKTIRNDRTDRSNSFVHDERYLRRMRNAIYSLSEVSRGECKCWKCGSVSHNLRHFPHDPAFHRNGCPIPGARLLVAPIDIAETADV